MDLTKDNIAHLIRKIALPTSTGYFFNTMFNVTDTYFAGQISTDALSAMSLSFPVFFLIVAFGAGFSTAVTALIGNALGRKNYTEAKVYSSQVIPFIFFLAIILSSLGLSLAPSLFKLMGATTTQYLNLCLEYINIIFYFSFAFMANYLFNGILSSKGDTKSFRNVLIVGFFLNIALDPLFIHFFGLKGVAISTGIIQTMGSFYMLYRVLTSDMMSKTIKDFIPKLNIFKSFFSQGIPSCVNMLTVALGSFIITFFVSKFGKEAVASYGAALRVEQIMLLPTIGLNAALLSITAQNFGAGNFKRVMEVRYKAFNYGLILALSGMIIIFLFGEMIVSLFSESPEVIKHGVAYLYIDTIAFFAYVMLFLNVAFLQGLKKPVYSLYIGLIRQIILPIIILFPVVYIYKCGLYSIYWSFIVITWISAILIYLIARKHLCKLLEGKII
ncbi:MAG: MATE family efflux transporter [Candidatus Delongbacteria bacterium]|nr:MATE family efflux transporter [Candidatus Delongbacteria bacterium]MBN2834003.1 MATE family efflux transporter [Candidatus Delongbacteria bacterium]